jgi:predicted enzyme related to lactoylglutathione lyase
MTDSNNSASGAGSAGASYPVSHVEWEVADGGLSAAFLERLFAWSFSRFSEHYWLYEAAQGPAIGLLEKAEPKRLDESCPVFIQVDDMAASLALAESLAAEIIEQPVAIEGYGRWAKIKEPGGNLVGLFEKV